MSQLAIRHSRVIKKLAASLSVTLAVLAACSQDPTASGPGGLPRSPALVSAPVTGAPSGASGLRLGVAYVSMVPGTDPAGASVTVRNGLAAPLVTAAMVDGGFDPIGIAAEAGDTLLITVSRLDGTSVPGYAVVQTRTRPVVVRTSPPNHKTDVVLNSLITIIFTQPMDSASLAGAVHLRHGGTEDAGTVTLTAGALGAVFTPASQLAPATTYQLEVSATALGQNGESLATPVQVTFTTGLTAKPVASVYLTPLSIMVGEQTLMYATPLDASGTPVAAVCVWSTSDATVAPIFFNSSLSVALVAQRPGTAVIRATCAFVSGEVTVRVVPVPTNLVFASVSAGMWHSCGVTTGGDAYCWGDNGVDELGNGLVSMFQSSTPEPVTGGLSFAMVSVAWDRHTCGVTTSGAAYCWGFDLNGGLGIGDPTRYWNVPIVPTAVVGGLTFTSVSTGYNHTCGVTTDGSAYCWGRGENTGELGNGTTIGSKIPVAVAGGLSFATVSAGGWYHSCGLTTSGAAYCWGDNSLGELGNGDATGPQHCGPDAYRPDGWPCSSVPVAVAGGLTFSQISTGAVHTCGVTTGGAAYCWGWNNEGQLGTGDTTRSASPVAVVGGLSFAMVSAGDRYNCGVTTDGAAYCWGYGPSGNLGDGRGVSSATPVAVAGGLDFAMVSAGDGEGYDHTCGVTTNGVAYCWGANVRGALGDGSVIDPNDFPGGPTSLVPVKVAYQP